MELDTHDIGILAILQKNNMVSQSEIGLKIGLSAPAVQRRIKRMRESGVIKADVSILDSEKLGSPITIFVTVKIDSESLQIISDVKENFARTPQVQQCHYVSGEVDFILVVQVFTMKEYEELTKELFYKHSFVKDYRSFFSMDVVKSGLNIPLRQQR